MEDQNIPVVNQASVEGNQAEDPGKTLAIVGLVFAFIFALIGLVLCIVARNKSEKAGFKNNIATVGIVVAIINMILGVILRLNGTI